MLFLLIFCVTFLQLFFLECKRDYIKRTDKWLITVDTRSLIDGDLLRVFRLQIESDTTASDLISHQVTWYILNSLWVRHEIAVPNPQSRENGIRLRGFHQVSMTMMLWSEPNPPRPPLFGLWFIVSQLLTIHKQWGRMRLEDNNVDDIATKDDPWVLIM